MDAGRPVRLDGQLEGRVPRAVRERQLLDVAEKLFKVQGYENTSIEDVARAAGVSRPVVYQHFGDKDGLFVACVRRARAELDEALAAATTPPSRLDMATALRRGGEAFFELLRRDPRRAALVLTTGTGQLADRLADLRESTVDRIARLVDDHVPGLSARDRRAAAYAIIGVAEELARWSLRHPDIPVETLPEYFTQFVTRGLVGAVESGVPAPGGPAPSTRRPAPPTDAP